MVGARAAVSTMLDRAPSIGPLLASVEAGTNSPSIIPLQRRAALEKSADESIRNAAIRIFGAATGAVSAETLADFVSKAHDGGIFFEGRLCFSSSVQTVIEFLMQDIRLAQISPKQPIDLPNGLSAIFLNPTRR